MKKTYKNERKRKQNSLSQKIPFSYPSGLPNGFSLISSRREVKSKTKTNRVCWCAVRSVQIGDLPLRLVVTPVPSVLSLIEFFRVLDC
jgi:hypothetical protein